MYLISSRVPANALQLLVKLFDLNLAPNGNLLIIHPLPERCLYMPIIHYGHLLVEKCLLLVRPDNRWTFIGHLVGRGYILDDEHVAADDHLGRLDKDTMSRMTAYNTCQVKWH